MILTRIYLGITASGGGSLTLKIRNRFRIFKVARHRVSSRLPLVHRLHESPAVALLGSRQVGKTTSARGLDLGKPSHYLDLERPSDLAKLADPELYPSGFGDQLVILDEVQRAPDLFQVLRSLIDERRRRG